MSNRFNSPSVEGFPIMNPKVMIEVNRALATFPNVYKSGGHFEFEPARPMRIAFSPMAIAKSRVTSHYLNAVLRYYLGSHQYYQGRKITSATLRHDAIVVGTENGVFIVTR